MIPTKRTLAPLGILALGLLMVAGCGGGSERAGQAAVETSDAPPTPRVATAPANGFSGDIAWRGLDEGLEEAREQQMPVMVVIHTTWCSKCKALKSAFQSEDLVELSEKFVMVNLDQDSSPLAADYSLDGTYIPRVVFLDSQGVPFDDLINEQGSPRYRYFYSDGPSVVASMRKALARTAPQS